MSVVERALARYADRLRVDFKTCSRWVLGDHRHCRYRRDQALSGHLCRERDGHAGQHRCKCGARPKVTA